MRPFGPFPPPDAAYPVAVAVSGGADSLCLALLVSKWRSGGLALIVDHGLRAEASDEAAVTARLVRSFGMQADVLTLAGLRRDGAIQESARAARYAALTTACQRLGALDLLLAHHRSDQIETVAIRRRAGSGPRGLAGMARCGERDGVRVLRPLLDIEPGRLRATLRKAGADWIEDPSNRNRRFERVRWREDLPLPERRTLAALGARYGRERNKRREVLAGAALSVSFDPAGFFRLPPALPEPDLLAELWRVVGSGKHPVPLNVMVRLVSAPQPATLGGAMLVRKGAGWILCRESSAVQEPCAARDGALWDGRWRLSDPGGQARGWMIAAAGQRLTGQDAPSVVRRSLPVLECGDEFRRPSGKDDEPRFVFSPPTAVLDGAFW
ncbi:tRNA lysidine(34) synthetase TilS [Acidomonas methanolica]|uniref:tRNA lysidine(34) synthetase TilS n=1 Tax=Acidomonas methanolica TaxID=437 RepID=UPI002119CC05|nr:tRNA lysidine(34) synthetase TilS [Acidomonas methanolica]MCQ9154340.1 tRNA lysidine(34) synthetase TilS [Acidomonas methanolica]